MEENPRKQRRNGEGSEFAQRKIWRNIGKSYVNKKGILKEAKVPPKQEKLYRKYTKEDENKVVNQINMFPRDVSHYTRNRSSKEYLSPDLNINRLYPAFNAQIKGNPENRQDLVNRLALHHRKAGKAIKMMQQDHKNSQLSGSSICTCSMDLQQVLFLPTLTHSFMNIRHEGTSGRGGDEIASCVLKLFLGDVTDKKQLTMWSDNCCGQNKNGMIIVLWIYLVVKGIFDLVDHKFLVSRHSFLSCDRDFAQIKKGKKVCKCIVPKDFVEMRANDRNVQPFVVTMMQKEDFLDFKEASNVYLNTQ
ncbi:hypothetical protein NQ314_014314 [Rhamnusium bicolor]|uniref:DUF7869 domain-containing protein n=1 Tax=Rhamnusium bicolor TaxID=1586634 RepID=A0AAV8X4Q3_9CUCU|nr:hypothetical protein NQ314_014314 [Rhamnusium bicolor]